MRWRLVGYLARFLVVLSHDSTMDFSSMAREFIDGVIGNPRWVDDKKQHKHHPPLPITVSSSLDTTQDTTTSDSDDWEDDIDNVPCTSRPSLAPSQRKRSRQRTSPLPRRYTMESSPPPPPRHLARSQSLRPTLPTHKTSSAVQHHRQSHYAMQPPRRSASLTTSNKALASRSVRTLPRSRSL